MPGNGAAKRGNAAGGAARRRLAERRKALGLTQEALADLMGVERTTVVRWERGETAPAPLIRPKLARALKVPADRLAELLTPGAPGAEGAAVPRQLPPAVARFTGRAAELAALAKILDDAGAPGTVVISAIGGTAGVGKTALAIQWAHQAADRFPDGQLYVNLRGYDPDRPMPPGDALAGFLRALGVPGQDIPPEEGERAARYRSLLAGRRVLVVLDNAGSAEQARPLLPGSATCAVVVTSRDSLTGLVARDGAARVDLDLLPLPDAVRLLNGLIGDRAAAAPAATQLLAERCCRLPLALRVAAELVAARPGLPLADLAAELASQQERLDVLDAGGDPRTAVRAVFSWSYQHLDPGTARAFRLAGLHPGADFDPYAVAALTRGDLSQARRTLDVLTRAHLVHPAGAPGPGRYTMHDLLRAYARELATTHDGNDEGRSALTCLFDQYLHAAATAMDTLIPAESHRRPRIPPPAIPGPLVTDPAAARTWLDTERASLVAMAAHTAEYGWPTHATQLATIVFRYLDSGGHYADATTIHSSARTAARRAGDRASEATALNALGLIALHQGRHQQAMGRLQEALALFRRVGDHSGQARALANLGILNFEQGRYEKAASLQEQALQKHRASGDRAGEIIGLGNLGVVEERQGRYEKAVLHLQQSLVLSRETGNSNGESYALLNLGLVGLRQSRYQYAIGQLRRALLLARQTGDRTCEAETLIRMGDVFLRQGRCEQAGGYHQRALALYREIGDRPGELDALNGLGEVQLAAARPGDARDQHAAALGLATESGDRWEQARAHEGLGHAHHALGDADEAARRWRAALALYTDLGVPQAARVRARLEGIGTE